MMERTDLATDPRHATSRRRRRFSAALLGVAVTAAVSTSAVAAGAGPARHDAAGSAVRAVHVGTRADVPWARVGSGWTLATWSPSGRGRATLFLIDPSGDRYTITHLAKGTTPLLWAPNGKRVLVSGPHHVTQVTLRTGAMHAIKLPAGQVVSYSRPKGLALIEAVDVPHGQFLIPRLERFGTDGQHQLTYPKSIKHAGQLDTNSVLETGNGAQLVIGARHGLVLLGNNGTLVRRLHATSARCVVASWWHKRVALAQCGNGRLWAVPISGAHATPLTESTSKEDPFGYSDAWRYSRGRLGLAPNGCGPESLVRFTHQGHGNRIDVPSPTGHVGRSSYIGHHGSLVDMLFVADRGCEAGKTVLFAYNAVKRTSTALLGPTVNGGSVISAIPYPTDK